MTNMIKCFKDINTMLLIGLFGVVIGVLNTYATIIGIICSQYGFTEDNASLFGSIITASGIFGSFAFGAIVEAKKNYK